MKWTGLLAAAALSCSSSASPKLPAASAVTAHPTAPRNLDFETGREPDGWTPYGRAYRVARST